MKKGFLKLSVLFVALFIGIIGANAEVKIVGESCYLTSLEDTNMACNLNFTITGTTTISTGDKFTVQLKNPSHIKDGAVTITPESGWKIDGSSDAKNVTLLEGSPVTIEVEYVGTSTVSAGTAKFGTGTYDKDDTYTDKCGFNYGFLINACDYNKGDDGNIHYYDSKGQYLGYGDEAKAKFYKDCFTCKQDKEGIWHGKEGQPLADEDAYRKECFSCYVDSENGKYYDDNGKETDEAGYKKACEKTCRQEKGSDKKWHYYDYDGNEITAEEFKNICQENPKTGSALPYVGIIAGVALIAVATVMVRKQSKLRRI